MMKINKTIEKMIANGIKKFQPIITSAIEKDINESDTVTIIKDVLSEVLGYDKYTEITSEFAIRNTYCDLAIKVDDKVKLLIEVKAVGVDLNEHHINQAVNYASNHGIEWVMLTNGAFWKVYKLTFGKPISREEIIKIDFRNLSSRSKQDIKNLFVITKKGICGSALSTYYANHQATDRQALAAVLLSESIVKAVRREVSRINPDVKISVDDIVETLKEEVIKRDLIKGEDCDKAIRVVHKLLTKSKASNAKNRNATAK